MIDDKFLRCPNPACEIMGACSDQKNCAAPDLRPSDGDLLREALKPLAALGVGRRETIPSIDHMNRPFYDCPDDLVIYNDNMGHAITVGDVRRAALADLAGQADQ